MNTPDFSLCNAVTIDHIQAAARRLAGVATRTPVLTSRELDARVGASVFIKPECLQRVGAFKFRGAYNAMSVVGRPAEPASARSPERATLGESSHNAQRVVGSGLRPEAGSESRPTTGVLAYSSGNHAQAIALSASILRIPAVIVMPADAPKIKLSQTRAYLADAPAGSEVVLYDRATQSREEIGGRIAAERGLTLVPPYDHPDVIAGQGTAALELIEDAGPLESLFVCVGGGGLISGCAVAAASVSPGCRVIGVEPAAGDDATRSFRTKTLHSVKNPATICDGAQTPSLGRYTFPLVLKHVADMMAVPDATVAGTMRWAMDRLKLVVEPTGVLGLAGLFVRAAAEPAVYRGTRIGVIVSGGNVDLDVLPGILALAPRSA